MAVRAGRLFAHSGYSVEEWFFSKTLAGVVLLVVGMACLAMVDAFLKGEVVGLPALAGLTDGGALEEKSIPCECSRAGDTDLFSEREVESVWALEAGEGDWVHIGGFDGAVGVIVLNAVPKHLVFVVLLGYVAIDPVLGIQVVLILAGGEVDEA